MTSIEKVFNELEEKGIVFKSANNLLHISISASDYLDIKRLAKEMEKQQIIDAYEDGDSTGDSGSGENYYNKTYASKESGMSEIPNDHIADTNKMIPSQTEISDKEIFYQKQVMNPYSPTKHLYTAWEKGFMDCAKWYREQIRKL